MNKIVVLLFSLLIGTGCDAESGSSQRTDPSGAATPEKISEFGKYEGYSNANAYDGYVRKSVYVPMRDGVRLAVDYFIPTKNGVETTEKLPVVFYMTPYRRAKYLKDGTVFHMLSEWGERRGNNENVYLALSRRGYIMAAVDVRGVAASFGGYPGGTSAYEARDSADMAAWFAEQPWSNGNVGMFGNSYLADTQFLAVLGNPPALKAIFPSSAEFDTAANSGGIETLEGSEWDDLVQDGANYIGHTPMPVDGPEGPDLLAQAMEEQKRLNTTGEYWRQAEEKAMAGAPWARDLIPAYFEGRIEQPSDSVNASAILDKINTANIPAYHWNAWNDIDPDGSLLWYANYTAPQKLTMTPATHHGNELNDPRGYEDYRLRAIEAGRWFDYWLKDIDNGVMDGAPINYAIQEGGYYSERDVKSGYKLGSWEWRSATSWPPSGVETVTMSFADGPSTSIQSVNDGRLIASGDIAAGADELDVDASVTTGRWGRIAESIVNPYGDGLEYPDMRENDAKSLTYTTAPLENDLTVVGAPIVVIHATSTKPDGAVHAWLEEVTPDGYSTLVTFGKLRASHRTLGEAPYNNLGKPWPTSMTADILATEPFNTGVAKLEFPLMSTSARFRAGSRLRLTISGANAGNYGMVEPDATITVSYGGEDGSVLKLPVMQNAARH